MREMKHQYPKNVTTEMSKNRRQVKRYILFMGVEFNTTDANLYNQQSWLVKRHN
jgi:DNA primase